MPEPSEKPKRSKPWVFRTYSGHSSAKASNALYRRNLEKGQTGLSVAFDLPTQTGYDPDHPLARGEVGKVGVPIAHIEDMSELFSGIPLNEMNTSMTINATSAWLLALYVVVGENQGVAPSQLAGTTQNDIIKEYLSRGTYIFPPQPSLKLVTDMVCYTIQNIPRWNPINICSYHLQEAGATPTQEIAYSLANAVEVLDCLVKENDFTQDVLSQIFSRFSFFVNSGIRFIDEVCKVRAMTELWEEIGRTRYKVTEEKALRFRYGVQVNSLGLTESQPENNIIRIVLESLGVTLSKNARCRALQLPAWNEALGLPRSWDQQWSLRIQQILANETDILEHEDIFDGSHVMQNRTDQLILASRKEIEKILAMGGAICAVESSYMKRNLVSSHSERMRKIETGETTVIGVNDFLGGETSPLVAESQAFLKIDEDSERQQIESVQQFRSKRNKSEVAQSLRNLTDSLRNGQNIMPPSIACARAGVTTGEWTDALRKIFGEYRAPTGVSVSPSTNLDKRVVEVQSRVRTLSQKLGRPPKILVGKPGLDGHSNGAEQVAVRARDVGMEVVYQGIRLTPDEILCSARDEGVHLIGLSILSGSHEVLLMDLIDKMKSAEIDIPIIVGGIIPEEDARKLKEGGVKRVFTPKNFDLTHTMGEIVDVISKEFEN